MEVKKVEICPNCRHINTLRTDHAHGEVVCIDCGVVSEDRLIDQTSEWRNFAAESSSHASDPSRVGGPRDDYAADSGLVIQIGDHGGRHTTLEKTHQKLSQEAGDKSLQNGAAKIKKFIELLTLSNETETHAKELFKKIVKKKKLKGRSLDAVAAAIIYVSSKVTGHPRNHKEVIKVTNTNKKEVHRCINLVTKFEPGMSVGENYEQKLELLCNQLDVNQKVRHAAIIILRNILSLELLGGKNPDTVAASALALGARAVDPELTYEKIAGRVILTVNTIKQTVKDIWIYRSKLLPKELLEHPAYRDESI